VNIVKFRRKRGAFSMHVKPAKAIGKQDKPAFFAAGMAKYICG
jgi:hypothetical protein